MYRSTDSAPPIVDACSIARDAYIYAYPMLLAYGFFHAQVCGPQSAQSQAMNRLTHFRRLGSPDFNNTIPWINTDTPYSAAWLDLRAEPFVLSVPAFEPHRFQNIQLVDWYTHNFANRGSRHPGNAAAQYLIAGPTWQGEPPPGTTEVLRSETWLVKLVARILLEGEDDYPNIHALQDRYRLVPLSRFLDRSPPSAAPPLDFPEPTQKGYFECASIDFIRYLNFLLTPCAVHASEHALMARFAAIGIGAGAPFDPQRLDRHVRDAIDEGIRDGHARIMDRLGHVHSEVNGWLVSRDLRGDRAVLAGNDEAYLRRAVAARYAIWGPSAEEVVYMVGERDADGETLDGNAHDYVLELREAPPARGFWSFTVYDARSRLLVRHRSGRYKLGDRDRGMDRAADGSFRIHLQYDSPGKVREANWLPVPRQPFQVVARFYWPTQALLDGAYAPPAFRKVR